MLREAMEAADYAIARWEGSVDRAIGRDARVRIGRLLAATILGLPVAWFIAGRRFDGIALGGLALGVALFAVIDVVRGVVRRGRADPPPPRT